MHDGGQATSQRAIALPFISDLAVSVPIVVRKILRALKVIM